jgi:hypothetical protein
LDWFDLDWFDLDWFDLDWFDLDWFDLDWFDPRDNTIDPRNPAILSTSSMTLL